MQGLRSGHDIENLTGGREGTGPDGRAGQDRNLRAEKGRATDATAELSVSRISAASGRCSDYGAAIFYNHAAPSVRKKLETEQRKCARVVTGCIKLTEKKTLAAEAELTPLALRAKELAAGEYERMIRLPLEILLLSFCSKSRVPDSATGLKKHGSEKGPPPSETEAQPPPPSDEDLVLTHKSCVRRVAEWARHGSGIDGPPEERMPLYGGAPTWKPGNDEVIRFGLRPATARQEDRPS